MQAAEKAFLRDGYAGASMESIARDAGVSIMTLYRHAETKDELFAAVIESACHPTDGEEEARLQRALKMPLADILLFLGIMFQDRVGGAATVRLLQVVMTELRRFPHLGALAYHGLIASHVDALDRFLSTRAETASLSDERRRALVSVFFDHLVGLETYQLLLGLPGASRQQISDRAARAVDFFLHALARGPAAREMDTP